MFFDTNVLVSAFATRGLCADLYRLVLAEHEILVGEVVLTELSRVLRRKLKVPAALVREIDQSLREHTVVPKPRAHLSLGLADRSDEWVAASALAGQAEVLVTGDAGLLGLASPPLPIVNPRGLWERFRRAEGAR